MNSKESSIKFIHNLIKIHFVNSGYLPNYPYHLISDAEMCDAFMSRQIMSNGTIKRSGYFYDAYPCLVPEFQGPAAPYSNLEHALRYHLNTLKSSNDPEFALPDWVYSYMLGKTIGVLSDKLDIHDLINPIGADNIDDEFTSDASRKCYEISRKWIQKSLHSSIDDTDRYANVDGIRIDLRPPTMFGEPHVIKSIRISELSPLDRR